MVYEEMCHVGKIPYFLLWYFIECTSSSLSCGELSLETMKIVASCPSSEDEKIKLARDKNCERYWKIFNHNCNEDPSTFQYHCVINDHRDKTIEVCSIKKEISGYCTEFNILGGKIQAHYIYDCTTFDPRCESIYNSTDAYLYKPCYNFSSEQGSHLAFTSGTSSTETLEIKQTSSTLFDKLINFKNSTTGVKTAIHTSEYEPKIRKSTYVEESTTEINHTKELGKIVLGYHIYIIYGLAGLLVLFVAICVFINVCNKFTNRYRSGRHNIQFSSKEVDLIPVSNEQNYRRTSENISEQGNPHTYLSPVSDESNYEEIHLYHSPNETFRLEEYQLPNIISDDKNGTYLDPNTYLTPISDANLTSTVDPKHAYVEVTG